MDFFIPDTVRVAPVSGSAADVRRVVRQEDIAAPSNNEFRKIYFEELARRCYVEDGNFESLQDVARIHHEEYYGVGGSRIKRWKVFFGRYNILVCLEEQFGRLTVTAA